MEESAIKSGLRVRVIGNEARTGVISGQPLRTTGGIVQAQVKFDDGGTSWMRISNLEAIQVVPDAMVDLRNGRMQGCASLRRNLAHEKLNGRLANVLYSMETSQTRFLPYQFKPVLKLLESPTNSLLIADEVGLGKTIEAGLIWTELKARTGCRNLVVVCPPHLREKWWLELSRRFGVKAEICNAAQFLRHLQQLRQEPSHSFAVITSYQGLRPPRDWEDRNQDENSRVQLAHFLNQVSTDQPVIDLLIMDEAHYMRNRENRTAELGELLCSVATHRVFLSATPIHTKNENLFNLLRLLDPDTFPNLFSFQNILEANAPLVRVRDLLLSPTASATEIKEHLRCAKTNFYLRESRLLESVYQDIQRDEYILSDPNTRSEMAFRVERANLLGHSVTRTRKREVFDQLVFREVRAIRVPLGEVERRFYNRVTELILRYADQRDYPSGFLTVMPQRQVASSMAAACASWLSLEAERDDYSDPDDFTESEEERPLVQYLRDNMAEIANAQDLERQDSKYDLLLTTLRDYWTQNPGEKVVLFSYFRPTLSYLRRRLAADGIESLLLVGGMKERKQDVVDGFRTNDRIRILLSSEVGSEGLDIQFAKVVINFDLPWNPMVVEQRIGRLDRIGQEADRILVFNFIAENTIDERIYDRLYDRLDLFRKTLGDLEDVVGPVITALSRDLLTHRLTPEEEQQKIEFARQAIANGMQQKEQLEKEASLLTAYGDYVIRQIRASHDLQTWIKGEEIERYVLDFFRNRFPASQFQGIDPTVRSYSVSLDSDAVYEFDRFLQMNKLNGQTTLNTLQRRQVRFDNRTFIKAATNEEIVTQSHPLVRFVGWKIRIERLAQCVPVAVRMRQSDAPSGLGSGRYAFNVQRWQVSGLRDFERLHYLVFDLERQQPIEDRKLAEDLVERCAGAAEDWRTAADVNDIGLLAKVIEALDDHASSEFIRFEQQCIDENSDRSRVQIASINSFEERRLEKFKQTLATHEIHGRSNLVEATKAQMTKLRERCELQRRAIRDKSQTQAEYQQICFGVVEIV